MKYDPEKHHRRSVRLAGYDYRTAGAYFVTICVQGRRAVFGRIEEGVWHPNAYGHIVTECWTALPHHFERLELDEWIVMPNHFHGIIVFHDDVTSASTPEARQGQGRRFGRSEAGSLSVVIGQFKMRVTQAINTYRDQHNLASVRVWQRGFHEHIIRHEKELNDTRRYIIENPVKWPTDKEYVP